MMKRLNSIRITVRKKRLPINDRRLFYSRYATEKEIRKEVKLGKDGEKGGKLYKYINLMEKRARAL